MASVSDVFKQLKQEAREQAEGEEIIDSNNYCMLESDTTRRILVPEKYSILGVESDERVKTVKFAFPRFVDDGRLDLMDYQIRINYKTANPDEENNKDQAQAQNVRTVGDYIVFDWLLSRRVTQYKGTITFIICAVTSNDDGTITTEWNTTLATSECIEGLEVSLNENEETQARDLLKELLANLNNSKNDAITEITQTKTQVISDIEAEGQTQISAVETKGAKVLESIPDDYTTLENRVDELEQNRAYVIAGNGSGEFVTLNDSSELKTRNVKLFGKSVQAETTGAQLFDIMAGKNEDDSQYKFTLNDYAAGKFTVSVENPSGPLPMPNNRLSDWCPTMTAGKTYYLSGNADTTANEGINLSGVSENWSFGTTRQITEEDLQSTVQFGFGTYSNIMIVEGSTEKPYEVYTGGEAATEPTSDYPLPITSAGNYNAESEKYEVGINVDGANLFPIQSVSSNYYGIKVDYQPDGGYRVHGKNNFTGVGRLFLKIFDFDLIPGEYSFSQNIVGESDDKSVYFTDSLKKITSDYVNEKTIVIDEPTSNIGYITISTKNDIDCVIYVMLNVGDKSLPFEISEHKLSTLQLPNPLRGTPVDSGGNYTDAEGQQWICDYIDRERGKYVQCVNEIVFDGSDDEDWRLWKIENNETERFLCNLNIAASTKVMNNEASICDLLVYSRGDNDYQHYKWSLTGNIVNQFIVFINKESAENVEELKSWLKSNNITLCYLLETPIETDLTSDQIAVLNLSTYQGITNIGTDTMPQVGIDVEYIADTKTYIDNAIAEAIAAIPTEQGGNNYVKFSI